MKKASVAAVVSCVLLFSCKPAEKAAPPAEVVVPPDSWLGIELVEDTECPGDAMEIRACDKVVKVAATIPTAPAEGLFKTLDIFLDVGGRPVPTVTDVQTTVREWPAGKPLKVTVRRKEKTLTIDVVPERKPDTNALLARLYAEKPFPTLGGTISTVETDGKGIVNGTQCVSEPDKKKPCLSLASGKATLVLFWSQYSPGSPKALSAAKAWQDRLGPRGLKVVGITSDPPTSLPAFLNGEDGEGVATPAMTVVSMFWGEHGAARFAARTNPTYLVLDGAGVIRAAAAASEKDSTTLVEKALSTLLTDPE